MVRINVRHILKPGVEGSEMVRIRVFPDPGLRVSDSQNAVWDTLTKNWGVP